MFYGACITVTLDITLTFFYFSIAFIYFLFTQLCVSNVGAAGGQVKIFRLQDPERGQTTLPFQPSERQ